MKPQTLFFFFYFCFFSSVWGIVTDDPLDAIATTHPKIYLSNLDGQIEHIQKKAGIQSMGQGERLSLAHSLWQKGLVFSNIPLIGDALELSKQEKDYLLRAKLKMSLHRFDSALKDLDLALKNGAVPQTVAALKQEIALNQGQEKSVDASFSPFLKTTVFWVTQARVLMEKGDYARANSSIDKGIAVLSDSNPLPVVAIYLLRAELEKRQSHPQRSLYFLEKAVERLPQHVGALEALSDHYLEHGPLEEALPPLLQGQENSPDPHLLAKIAHIYRLQGKQAEARLLEDEAEKKFHLFLKDYSETYEGEATQFFSRKPTSK